MKIKIQRNQYINNIKKLQEEEKKIEKLIKQQSLIIENLKSQNNNYEDQCIKKILDYGDNIYTCDNLCFGYTYRLPTCILSNNSVLIKYKNNGDNLKIGDPLIYGTITGKFVYGDKYYGHLYRTSYYNDNYLQELLSSPYITYEKDRKYDKIGLKKELEILREAEDESSHIFNYSEKIFLNIKVCNIYKDFKLEDGLIFTNIGYDEIYKKGNIYYKNGKKIYNIKSDKEIIKYIYQNYITI